MGHSDHLAEASASTCLTKLLLLVALAALAALLVADILPEGAIARLAGELGLLECQVSPAFPSQVLRWCEPVTRYATQAGLPPDLVAAIIWLESGGQPEAFSHSGAVGLMQVMPSDGPAASFTCPKGPCFAGRPTMVELSDPEFNIEFGITYLAELVQIYDGDLREALRAYGPMDVDYRYADAVIALFVRYGEQE